MKQDRFFGPGRWMVDRMIRRSVRKAFHTVWWRPPGEPLKNPSVLIANHHGWHDGYLMYLAGCRLGLSILMWIQEYDAFPLFGQAGGMPFPADDPVRRVVTVRRTLRGLKSGRHSLVLFPEGELHRPPELLPFGRSLELIRKRLPDVPVISVAIRYELSMHERPEAFLVFGSPEDDLRSLREETEGAFEVLMTGTPDVNERWDMRRLLGR